MKARVKKMRNLKAARLPTDSDQYVPDDATGVSAAIEEMKSNTLPDRTYAQVLQGPPSK
ncbi:hypothetical protein I204_00110 [Kwoniella mangroviensis CBS 8886]|nr:hypothetical protein I204_00110 [Kwoniella mangroviensis CBS 8886]